MTIFQPLMSKCSQNAFTEEVVKAMASLNTRPIIFPLSNPVSLCEVEYDVAVKWTEGKVIFASGSPYQSFEWEGKTFEPGQGNNMYVFPGIGLGIVLSGARHVTDEMVEAASIALSSSLNDEELAAELVYPRLDRIRQISGKIALAVIRKAQEQVCVESSDVYRELHCSTYSSCIEARRDNWSPPPVGRCPGGLYSHQNVAASF
jgi:malate dehydrogenase (oxaloacetate-decarboxylating)(NADP+)